MTRSLLLIPLASAALALLGCVSSSPPPAQAQAQAYRRPASSAPSVDQALDELLAELPPETLVALLQAQQTAAPAPVPAGPSDAELRALVQSLSPAEQEALLRRLMVE